MVNAIHSQYVNLYAKQLKEALSYYQTLSAVQSNFLVAEQIEGMKTVASKIHSLLDVIADIKRVLDELADDEDELALMNLTLLEVKPALYRSVLLDLMLLCFI